LLGLLGFGGFRDVGKWQGGVLGGEGGNKKLAKLARGYSGWLSCRLGVWNGNILLLWWGSYLIGGVCVVSMSWRVGDSGHTSNETSFHIQESAQNVFRVRRYSHFHNSCS
jgi:hypothetical protein